MQRTQQTCVELAAELVPDAERELAAFARAVQERFGFEQVRQSVEDWMAEMESMDFPAGGAIPDWRRVTISAAGRLAIRAHSRPKNADEFPILIGEAS